MTSIHAVLKASPVTPDHLRRTREKAATLVMLQPSAPAREPTAWMHAPSQPLMRSLLSQFQTPTAPRRTSRFFRVWLLVRSPC